MVKEIADTYKKYLDYLIVELTAEENQRSAEKLQRIKKEIPVVSSKIALLTRVIERPDLYIILQDSVDDIQFIVIKPKNLFAFVRIININVNEDKISDSMVSYSEDDSTFYIEGDKCFVKSQGNQNEINFRVEILQETPDVTNKYIDHITLFLRDVYPQIEWDLVDHKVMGTCILLKGQTIESLNKINFLNRIFSLRWSVTEDQGSVYMFRVI